MRREEFMPDVGNLDTFEAMCKREKKHCPAATKDKGNDWTAICHWCRISYDRGVGDVKSAVINRLFSL